VGGAVAEVSGKTEKSEKHYVASGAKAIPVMNRLIRNKLIHERNTEKYRKIQKNTDKGDRTKRRLK
jgi:hypothetical protein